MTQGEEEATGKEPKLSLTFGEITEKNVGQLQVLNSVLFPVKYNEKFYTDLLRLHTPLTVLAYHNDILVGAVCCRVESHPLQSSSSVVVVVVNEAGSADSSSTIKKLYIMTLGVLAPYRRLGIGSKLLEAALKFSKKEAPQAEVIFASVWTMNTSAVEFYKRHGFQIVKTVHEYYKNLDPGDCFVVEKNLKAGIIPLTAGSSVAASSIPAAAAAENR